jgi:hypothetical protein
MNAEAVFQHRALRRTYVLMRVLAAAGAMAGLAAKGWLWALAFLLGAGASYFNFAWLHQAVETLGPGAPPPRRRIFVFLAARYLLLGGAGYVTIKIFGMNAVAALAGLFVPLAAILLEILYELIHERT